MRTAILFLIGVELIVLIGSFVPQQNTSAQEKVDAFTAANPHLINLATDFGLPLTSVFVSPLFFVLLGSLYIALGACVIRRGRALVMRVVRRRPRTTQFWGEVGSWLFHTSFFLLLVAVLWGKSTGFQGIMTVVQGQRVTEARADYDQLQEGLLFNGKHTGYQIQLNHFSATYAANGEASDFVSNVTVYDHGRAVETRDIRVNDFLRYDDVDFYQQDYGWAPHMVVKNPAGQVVFDGYIECFAPEGTTSKDLGTCVLKVPDFGYTPAGASKPLQIGANIAILPDAKTTVAVDPNGTVNTSGTTYVPGGQTARNPVLQVQLMVGDLSLTGAQDVNALDTTKMVPYFSDGHPIPLPMGQTLSLPLSGSSDVFTVSFPDLKQYSLFMVKRDNGVGLVYVTFGLIMTGLMLKLYVKPAIDRHRSRRGNRDAQEPAATGWLDPGGAPHDHVGEREREPVGAGAGGAPPGPPG